MSRIARIASAAVVLWMSLVPPTFLSAQTMPRVSEGDRVRVSSPLLLGPAEGRVLSLNESTLVLRPSPADDPVHLSLPEVQRLEVSRGRASRGHTAMKYGGIGLLAGGVTGALISYASFDEPDASEWCLMLCTRKETALFGGMLLGLISGTAGGIVGALSPPQRWERVPLAGRVSLDAAAGNGVALSISFQHGDAPNPF